MTVYSPAVPPPEENDNTPAGDRIIGGLQVRNMSPADATAALAAMQKAYEVNKPVADKLSSDDIRAMSPQQATAALAEMSKRPLDILGKPIPLPPREIISSAELQERRNAEFFNDLENRNFPARGTPVGDDLWNMMEGRSPVTPELQKATEAKLKSMQADLEWRNKLLAGDQEAERQFHIATAIITAGKMQRPGDQSQW
jgi:hypothetical protein